MTKPRTFFMGAYSYARTAALAVSCILIHSAALCAYCVMIHEVVAQPFESQLCTINTFRADNDLLFIIILLDMRPTPLSVLCLLEVVPHLARPSPPGFSGGLVRLAPSPLMGECKTRVFYNTPPVKKIRPLCWRCIRHKATGPQ